MGATPLILVVDDEEKQRLYFERMLASRGYRVVLSANAADGLRAACAARPALIILDVNMPGMDGIGGYHLFKKVSATREIPILLATALPLPPGALKLVSSGLGGVPVLLKQDGLEKLLSLVSSIIGGRLPPQTDLSPDARSFQRAGREIVMNARARRISIDGRELPPLAARRFDLLSTLLEAEQVLSREELLERIWKDIDNPNLVDVTVLRLREDLKKVRLFGIRAERDGYIVVFREPRPHT